MPSALSSGPELYVPSDFTDLHVRTAAHRIDFLVRGDSKSLSSLLQYAVSVMRPEHASSDAMWTRLQRILVPGSTALTTFGASAAAAGQAAVATGSLALGVGSGAVALGSWGSKRRHTQSLVRWVKGHTHA